MLYSNIQKLQMKMKKKKWRKETEKKTILNGKCDKWKGIWEWVHKDRLFDILIYVFIKIPWHSHEVTNQSMATIYLFTYSHSFLYEILNSETDIPTHYYCQQNFLSHYNNSVEEEYKDFTEDSLLCRIL